MEKVLTDLTYYRHNKNKISMPIPEHKMIFSEITFVFSGTLDYYINDTCHFASTGDMIYVQSGSLRKRTVGTQKSDYVSFNFIENEPLSLPTLSTNIMTNEIKLLTNICDQFIENSTSDYYPKLNHLLMTLILHVNDCLKNRNANPLCLKIKKYLHENYNKKITLEDIGKHTFFSPYYCDSIFKKEMGKSIIDYLITLKIEHAKLLLNEGILSKTEISETLAFSDYNYFSRLFKKRVGYTPSEYKNITKP